MADRAGSWPDDGPIGIILATYFLVVNVAGFLEDLLSSFLAHPVVGLINLIDNLLVRPGNMVKLHQRQPSFVIECEDSMIAIDEKVAANINVWVGSERPRFLKPHGRRGTRRGFHHGFINNDK